MKILKKVLFVILIIIAIQLVVALFVKKDYHIERQVLINVPVETVFNYVKYLKNQDNYSKWNKLDPEMEKYYTGEDGTVGFVAGWKSNNKDVGSGEQEITKIETNSRMDFELRFFEPMTSTDNAFMSTKAQSPQSTTVTWGIYGTMKYPSNLMKLFMDFDKMLGGDLDEGLNNLKKLLEKK